MSKSDSPSVRSSDSVPGARALKFVARQDGVEPVRSELSDELIRAFAKTRLQTQPTAYVVLNTELRWLARFDDLVFDRGRKHQAKPLAKLLLGHSKIPFINGSYESSGQLVRSIRTLLENAYAKDDHNIYIIGTSEKILEELWERAGGTEPVDRACSKAPATKHLAKSRANDVQMSQHLLSGSL
jgi:hypothetical protein